MDAATVKLALEWASTQPFRFSDLPVELQEIIITHLIDKPWTLDTDRGPKYHFYGRAQSFRPKFNIPMPPLLVSKALHQITTKALANRKDNVFIADASCCVLEPEPKLYHLQNLASSIGTVRTRLRCEQAHVDLLFFKQHFAHMRTVELADYPGLIKVLQPAYRKIVYEDTVKVLRGDLDQSMATAARAALMPLIHGWHEGNGKVAEAVDDIVVKFSIRVYTCSFMPTEYHKFPAPMLVINLVMTKYDCRVEKKWFYRPGPDHKHHFSSRGTGRWNSGYIAGTRKLPMFVGVDYRGRHYDEFEDEYYLAERFPERADVVWNHNPDVREFVEDPISRQWSETDLDNISSDLEIGDRRTGCLDYSENPPRCWAWRKRCWRHLSLPE